MPKFSIVIPVYNAGCHLNTMLTSIVATEYEDMQLILVDDGSSDDSAGIVKEFVTKHNYCELYTILHNGVSNARNFGLSKAKGDYVLFFDADDRCLPNAFNILAENIDLNNADVIVFGAEIENYNSEYTLDDIIPHDKVYNGFDSDVLFGRSGAIPYVWNSAYKREFLLKIGAQFDTSVTIGEDLLFQFSVLPYADKIQFIGDKLYHYNFLIGDTAISTVIANHSLRAEKHTDLVDRILTTMSQMSVYNNIQNDLILWLTEFLMLDYKYLNCKESSPLNNRLKKILKHHKINIIFTSLPVKKKVRVYCLLYYNIMKIFKKRLCPNI